MSLKNMIYPPLYAPHSTNIFTPMEIEKILDTTLTKDNCRFYKVKWVRVSWETESELAYFSNIIDEFWAQYADESLIAEDSSFSQENTMLSAPNQCENSDHEKVDLVSQSLSSAEVIESEIKNFCGFHQHFQDSLNDEISSHGEVTTSVSLNDKDNPDGSEESADNPASKVCKNNIAGANEVSLNKENNDTTDEGNHKKYICNKCGKVLASQSNYEKHYSSHKLKICNMCNKEFTRMAHLRAHQEIHKNERSFKCDECSKGFNDRTTLKKHKLTHSERMFACNQCDKLFQRREHLSRHIKNIHENIRKHACHICGKMFHEKNSLLCHMNIHTGVKKHRCEDCGKSFTERSTLINHRACHMNAKPFTCETCKKQFTRKATLKMHMKKHFSASEIS